MVPSNTPAPPEDPKPSDNPATPHPEDELEVALRLVLTVLLSLVLLVLIGLVTALFAQLGVSVPVEVMSYWWWASFIPVALVATKRGLLGLLRRLKTEPD